MIFYLYCIYHTRHTLETTLQNFRVTFIDDGFGTKNYDIYSQHVATPIQQVYKHFLTKFHTSEAAPHKPKFTKTQMEERVTTHIYVRGFLQFGT